MALTRPRHAMPDDIEAALKRRGLLDDYRARPAYQQNDYIGWITRTREDATRDKRLNQMLDELDKGGVYMNMTHAPSRKS